MILDPPDAAPLLAAFQARLGAAIAPELAVAIAERLRGMLLRARERWPTLGLDPAIYGAHVAGCVAAATDLPAALDALHGDDLYLACACAGGCSQAIAQFEASFAVDLARGLARVRSPGVADDDVLQTVREKLFTAAPGRRPRIAEYLGTGELRSWVRITVLRTHLNMDRSRRRRPELARAAPEALLEVPGQAVDPELDYLKVHYRAAFTTAFEHALAGLDPRDRNLLRRSLVDRLGVDELGAIHGVHRATAARWVARARATLLAATRSALGERLGVDERELASILRLVESQLDVSVQRLLASRPAEPSPP